jgi:hypothetical protein
MRSEQEIRRFVRDLEKCAIMTRDHKERLSMVIAHTSLRWALGEMPTSSDGDSYQQLIDMVRHKVELAEASN